MKFYIKPQLTLICFLFLLMFVKSMKDNIKENEDNIIVIDYKKSVDERWDPVFTTPADIQAAYNTSLLFKSITKNHIFKGLTDISIEMDKLKELKEYFPDEKLHEDFLKEYLDRHEKLRHAMTIKKNLKQQLRTAEKERNRLGAERKKQIKNDYRDIKQIKKEFKKPIGESDTNIKKLKTKLNIATTISRETAYEYWSILVGKLYETKFPIQYEETKYVFELYQKNIANPTISMNDLIVIAFFYEVTHMNFLPGWGHEMCTAIIYQQGNDVYHGRNFDWVKVDILSRSTKLLKIINYGPNKDVRFKGTYILGWGFAPTDAISLTGKFSYSVNSKRHPKDNLSIFDMTINRILKQDYMPAGIVITKIMEQTSYYDAKEFILSTKVVSGAYYVLTSGTKAKGVVMKNTGFQERGEIMCELPNDKNYCIQFNQDQDAEYTDRERNGITTIEEKIEKYKDEPNNFVDVMKSTLTDDRVVKKGKTPTQHMTIMDARNGFIKIENYYNEDKDEKENLKSLQTREINKEKRQIKEQDKLYIRELLMYTERLEKENIKKN